MLHGAKDRSINSEPFFDRWSWTDVFSGYMLSISDPTLQLDSNLALAWYGGNYDEHPLTVVVEIVKSIAKKYGISNSDIIFWGSSGGGFASMYASIDIEGASSVVFNPQTAVLDYHEKHVKNFLSSCFNINDLSNLPPSILDRLLLNFYRIKNSSSKIMVFQNINDGFHYVNHYLRLKKKVSDNRLRNFSFYTYYDAVGHGPENKDLARSALGFISGDIEKGCFEKLLKKNKNEYDLSAKQVLDLFKSVRDGNGIVDDIDSIYNFAIKKYPNGWSIRSVYSEIKFNVGDLESAHKGFLSVKDQLGERTPSRVFDFIRKIESFNN